MRRVFQGRSGVQYDEAHSVTNLMFDDDSTIFLHSDAEATDILYDIAHITQSYGLWINVDKTKMMTTDGSEATIQLGEVQTEQTYEFKYLGSLVQEKKVASTAEVHSRIVQTTTAFASHKWCLWKRTNFSITTKIHLLQALILSDLLYGSELWILLKPDLNKLEVFQMQCMHQIWGLMLHDSIKIESIQIRCGQQPKISEQIQNRRLCSFGHMRCRLLLREYPANWKVHKSAL